MVSLSFIRTKKVNGNIYAYKVESKRINGRVVQKVLAYLGRADGLKLRKSKK